MTANALESMHEGESDSKFPLSTGPSKKILGLAYGRSVYIFLEFLENGTINDTWYSDTLSKLKEAIRKKRPRHLKIGVLLLDDNTIPQSTTATQNRNAILGLEEVYHSPDLAPSDFHLFPVLKKNFT
ncbi:histone-lysine N-methyltransferase SETMAR [Trichonephila clavipes]|nr:histone-lysine N-methyltransferase SETMAR [Trichonephila clavipes]